MRIITTILALTAASVFSPVLRAADCDVNDGPWAITLNEDKTLTIAQNGNTFVKNAYATATLTDGTQLNTTAYSGVKLEKSAVSDGFGSGTKYSYVFYGLSGKDSMEQNFYIYPSLPYMLTEAVVVAAGTSTSAYEVCPLVSRSNVTLPLPSTSDNRVYDMPFANDNWATFSSNAWSIGQPMTSCEATVMYNISSRQGVIFGSVDHSDWKSAVTVTPAGTNRVRNMELKSGYISQRTWDVVNGKASSSRHGEVKGARVASARFMTGIFDDWRTALETYGDANTVLCPKYEWDKDEALFGWQSWGGMEWGLNYNSAMSLLDFYEKELKPLGFGNKAGRCYIVLDSGWDALNDTQLRKFADKCKELGFVAGIYTTPFSYWGSEDDCRNNKAWEGGQLGEMVLKANGRYRQINGMSLDPTHPKVKEWNRRNFEKFKNLGFGFVKIDFMNNGSQEADSWYDPNITTGMQAYNYGMDYIKEFAGDMMLDFSIAPIFPAKAHVRRIGCDAWGDLPQSMYTLNCINGSWWLDRVYAFNDPDHMCLSKVSFSGKGSNDEQEARIRYTCGLMTGMTLLGGTYAYEGDTKQINGSMVHVVGNDAERARVVKFASNADLTQMGRIGKTFRPVEGAFNNFQTLYNTNDISVDNEFIYDAGESFYYVVFNYDKSNAMSRDIDFARIGINPKDYTSVKELWTGTTCSPEAATINVPAKDVRIYRFDGKSGAGSIGTTLPDSNDIRISTTSGSLTVETAGGLAGLQVFGIDGRTLLDKNCDGLRRATFDISSFSPTAAIIRIMRADGSNECHKVLLR